MLVFLTFIFFSSPPRKCYKQISSEEKLIGKSTASLDKGPSLRSSTHHIPIPMTMNNNMVIATSFGKSNHWQRMEEANLGLLTERDDNYGSFETEIHRETIA